MDSYRVFLRAQWLLFARLLSAVFVVALAILLYSGSHDERAAVGAAIVTFGVGLATLGGRR